MKSQPRRSSLRLQHYDYSQSGAYFVTICTNKKEPIFGQIVEDEIRLSVRGQIVQSTWESLPIRYPKIQTDAFIVMPNHIHGIIMIVGDNVGAIMMLDPKTWVTVRPQDIGNTFMKSSGLSDLRYT
jgi:putative transposase